LKEEVPIDTSRLQEVGNSFLGLKMKKRVSAKWIPYLKRVNH